MPKEIIDKLSKADAALSGRKKLADVCL